MDRLRAILLLTTLVSVALLRPMHWGVHALGGHAACHDGRSELAVAPAHTCCDHDHADADGPRGTHHDQDAPADRDDLADCELCLAIALLSADPVAAPLQIPYTVPAGQPFPASIASPRCQADHAPLHARPPPASTT